MLREATISGVTAKRVELRDCDLTGLRGAEALRGVRMPWNDVLQNAPLFAGVVGGQSQECIVLFFCNDIGDVPFEPISVAPFELLFLLSGANRD